MIIFGADAYVEHWVGGAELTTQAIIDSCLLPNARALNHLITVKILEENKDKFWIFGNFKNLSEECLFYAVNNLSYSVIEYDYKFCKFRSIQKHVEMEGQCDCHQSRHGKLVSAFLARSKMNWWMSIAQKELYRDRFPFIEGNILSSIFSDDTLDYIESLDTSSKNNKWVILDAESWIKGTQDTIKYANENGLEYELVKGLEYKDLLKKLSISRGLLFIPKAGDTCPRLTIEAKLLGCELILNENVQHKDEPWFETQESCLSYLQKRKIHFWNSVEQYISYLPKSETVSEQKYIIIVPFYNVGKYISKCIHSLMRQRHQNFQCFLIDDMSTDNTVDEIEKLIYNDSRFSLKQNKEKCFALKNIYNSLKSIDLDPEDVVILLDGDDWLSSSKTLNCLNSAYEDDVLMTYGSYMMHPHGVIGSEPSEYPEHIVQNNLYREDTWRASHLRTFKYHLWERISPDDLKDNNGDFFDVTYDQSIMLPLLEMSGHKAQYIDSVLHVYNKENPLNVDKIKTQKQVETATIIRSKQKYKRIN